MVINNPTLFKKELLNTDRLLINTLVVSDINDPDVNIVRFPYGLVARINKTGKFVLYNDKLDNDEYKIGEFSKIIIHNILYEVKYVNVVLYPYGGTLSPNIKRKYALDEFTKDISDKYEVVRGTNTTLLIEVAVYVFTNPYSVNKLSNDNEVCSIFCPEVKEDLSLPIVVIKSEI